MFANSMPHAHKLYSKSTLLLSFSIRIKTFNLVKYDGNWSGEQMRAKGQKGQKEAGQRGPAAGFIQLHRRVPSCTDTG